MKWPSVEIKLYEENRGRLWVEHMMTDPHVLPKGSSKVTTRKNQVATFSCFINSTKVKSVGGGTKQNQSKYLALNK